MEIVCWMAFHAVKRPNPSVNPVNAAFNFQFVSEATMLHSDEREKFASNDENSSSFY